ncbi:MAG: hypothetical protein U0350_24560 [Caldilineaceae bacterium]
MSHPFGDLISQYLHRKHGLSQAKLAEGILQNPSIIAKMCKGERLHGPQARERVLAILQWLCRQAVLATVAEANQLLAAAGKAPLRESEPAERVLLGQLHGQPLPRVSAPPAASVTPAHKTNLPVSLTSFVGRTQEVADVTQRIATQRLVTLTGVGGVGKTRLALEMAKAVYDFGLTKGEGTESEPRPSKIVNRKFPDGVWWVELAALTQPELVAQTIACLFNLTEQTGRATLERLQAYLADKQLLLILDNCEHVIDTCAALVERLLQHCWQLHILTTSREELRIPGEMLYSVFPLALPSLTEYASEDVLACAAAQLFVERMRTTSPSQKMQEAELAALAHICRQLDGIPLALELAAPLTRSMSLAEIAMQLDNQMALLTNNYRTAIPRHQTMHSALVWSYRLLAPEEQSLLSRAAVFVGGWTLAAAQAVCVDRASPHITAAYVAALLNQLIGKSLVLTETQNGERRYRLLEPVRQFAHTHLVASGEQEAIQRRHADYFLGLAEQMEQARDTPQERAWLQTLGPERNNLRAVNDWAFARNEVEFAHRFNGCLFAFWHYYSSLSEASHWLEGALALQATENAAPRPPSARLAEASALDAAGYAAALGANFTRAQTLFERELRLCTELGEQKGIAAALRGISFTLRLNNNLSQAQHYGEQALALSLAGQDKRGIAWARFDLGSQALIRGELTTAQTLLTETLPLLQEQGINWGVFRALLALGYVMRTTGKPDQALRFYRDALHLQQQMHYVQHIADALEGLAAIAVGRDDLTRAVWLFGAAHTQRQAYDWVRPYHQEAGYERDVALTRSRLDGETWNAAWAEGSAMTLEQAVEYALAV